jgi:UDP-sugar pyrophosphorylase
VIHTRYVCHAEQKALAELLLGAGQAHLFAGWAAPGTDDAEKHAFFGQVQRLHQSYPFPGGLTAYIGASRYATSAPLHHFTSLQGDEVNVLGHLPTERARALLAASREGANPLEGWTPSVPPDGEHLLPGTDRYVELEGLGEPEVAGA